MIVKIIFLCRAEIRRSLAICTERVTSHVFWATFNSTYGELRPCTEKGFLLSCPSFYGESGLVTNS